jgi:hypothetical protein
MINRSFNLLQAVNNAEMFVSSGNIENKFRNCDISHLVTFLLLLLFIKVIVKIWSTCALVWSDRSLSLMAKLTQIALT